jgi:tetratricopeptide (TPR) repeat protein
MSFTPDLRNRIRDFSCDLSALKPLLQEDPAWKNNEEKEELLRLHLEIKEINERVSESLNESGTPQVEEPPEIVQFRKAFATYVGTLKKSSMTFYSLGRYQECYEVLTLLVDIEPDNTAASDFLEITRQKVLEGRDTSGAAEEAPPHNSTEVGNDTPIEREISRPISAWIPEPAELDYGNIKSPSGRSWRSLTVVALLLLGILAWAWTQLKFEPVSNSSIEVQSEPDSAQVFLNGLPVGKTQLRLDSIEAGSYGLRLEKEGYAPITRQLVIEKNRPCIISFRLVNLDTQPSSLVSLRERAQALFDLGNLAEAGLICNMLLKDDPHDSFAIKLKENIHNYYVAPIVHEELDSDEKAHPPEVPMEAHGAPPKPLPMTPPVDIPKEVSEKPTRPIALASDLPKAKPPAKPAGLSGTPGLTSASSGETKQVSIPVPVNTSNATKLDSVNQQDVVAQIESRIQAKEFDKARNLLSQIQNIPSAQAEWKGLAEKLRVEEANQQSLVLPWVQKAGSALVAGHYVTPPDDNVVLYCNRALAIDPLNQKALALKKDVVGRSIAQAKEWVERGKFDEARLYYSSLNYLSQNDNGFPTSRQEFQQELSKVEFSSYPVVHAHRFGSCRGRLRMNSYVVSFVPSESSLDGFTEKLMYVTLVGAGDDLKIKVKDKSYRFLLDTDQAKEGAQKAAKPMYDQLMKLLSPKS